MHFFGGASLIKEPSSKEIWQGIRRILLMAVGIFDKLYGIEKQTTE